LENFAYILDYLPNGRTTEHGFQREAVALGLGESELKLLEILPRLGSALEVGARIPLTPQGGVAPPIDHVRRRLSYNELTTTARTELPGVLEKLVLGDPPRFLRFVNEAPAVSRRFHLLELLPGIGKKTMLAIVEERKRAPFTTFPELGERMHLAHPERLVVARIEQELSGAPDKYRLFVAP
jgi:putative nucleotide binding protein